jgi:ACR3 family arsenite efflux pump ArsB
MRRPSPSHLATFIIPALVVGWVFGRVLRLGARDSFTTGVLFAVRNVELATAIAITLLGRIEYAVFAAVYFVTEVPLLFGAVALYRRWWARASDAAKVPAAPELHP